MAAYASSEVVIDDEPTVALGRLRLLLLVEGVA
jgi:hypothetical protein